MDFFSNFDWLRILLGAIVGILFVHVWNTGKALTNIERHSEATVEILGWINDHLREPGEALTNIDCHSEETVRLLDSINDHLRERR